MSSAATTTADLLADYRQRPGHFDECRLPDGVALRPAWAEFFSHLGSHPQDAIRSAVEACRRAVLEQDVSMNVYAGDGSTAHVWPLDPIPLLLGSDDWTLITDGLRQRARLYNALLNDLYGPQHLLRDGHLPASLAMASPHFLRACHGLGRAPPPPPPPPPPPHTYAADIARSPDGRWWVIEDRLDAPSGLGYSLQNRMITREVLPRVFQRAPVTRLHRFFHDFRQSLETLASHGSTNPRVVFLTPGPANETWFEHAYLARYLGFPLVEGADLTTRDRQVFLRTVGGLHRVDVIVRRVDSDFCDPLELNDQSLLGVPGLIEAAQARRVAIANLPGGRALETTALLAFLAPLCRHVLGEELRLPSVATWWCGHDDARRYVLENLHGLVIKPTFPTPGSPPLRYGPQLSEAGRATLARDIKLRPWAWCGQERVLLGTTPGLNPATGHLTAMPFIARIHLAWHDGDYQVMPGGLARCNPVGEDAIVSLQTGSVAKDIWVLHAADAPPEPASAPAAASVSNEAHDTPSRLADDLFWLGRYLERTGQLARMLAKLEPLLRDEIATLDPAVVDDAVRLLCHLQQVPVPEVGPIEKSAAFVRRIATDPGQPGSLNTNLERLGRSLEAVKSRLPPEAWQMTRRLRESRQSAPGAVGLRAQLAALDGILAENLPRNTAWHFLDLGRRIERSLQILNVLQHLLGDATGTAPSEFRLQTTLHLADSLFAYRSMHHGAFHPETVLQWLVTERENTRGLHYQADLVTQSLAALPDRLAPRAVEQLRNRALYYLSIVRMADTARFAAATAAAVPFWQTLVSLNRELSAQLTEIYFSHARASGADTDQMTGL
ncbi:hypothetical protein Ga0100230_006045 [Opitutaceae bacterium TAV3]|nr:hypothetical protein Ga0100230_006045 [Opitutaceae bacterium TAV3]